MQLRPARFTHHAARGAVLFLCSTLLHATAFGALADEPQSVAQIDAGQLLSVAGGLFTVVLAIFVVGILYSRLKGVSSTGGAISIVASQALGPKERIAIVDVAGTQLVVGMTATQVQMLHVLETPVDLAAGSEATTSFAERLRQSIRKVQK